MNVLLINPPQINEVLDNTPRIISEGRGFSPPLGLLYLAAYLERRTSHQVAVLDCQVDRLDDEEILERIRDFSPDVVGITAMTMTLIDVIAIVRLTRQTNPHIKIIIGGPHAHLFPEETINLTGVDFVVKGEGEISFKTLLDSIHKQAKLREIPGIVFKQNGKIVNTGLSGSIADLDALPFPARHLVPYEKYFTVLSKRRPATTIFSSRGCPFKCTFCDRPHLGKKFRARSPKNIVDELEACIQMGISEFIFYDDTFTVDKQRVIHICDEIIKRKFDLGFDIRARVDTIDDPLLLKLRQAGCHGIHYGVESGTKKILKVLNKGINFEDITRASRLTRKHGISTLAYFMIGNPFETVHDIKETVRFINRLDPDFLHLTVLTPFPGTKIYQMGLETGIIARDVWREFAEKPTADFIPPHWDEHFTREQLSDLVAWCYKKFYMRPSYILGRLKHLDSWNDVKSHVAGFFRMLGFHKGY